MRKKRILVVLLSSAIVFSGMPGNVFAAEEFTQEEEFFGGEDVTEDIAEEPTEDVGESVLESDQGAEEFAGFSDGEGEDFVTEDDEINPEAELFTDGESAGTEDTEQNNIKWEIVDSDDDGMDDTLVISGNGDMEIYQGAKYTPWYSYVNSIENIIIGNDITSISACSFQDLKKCKKVTLGNSIKIIGNNAFQNCISIKEVVIPDGVTNIESGAFSGCTSLKKVIIPDSVTYIGWRVFEDCKNLTYVKMSENIISLGKWAFYNCRKLENIYLPLSLNSIGDKCFFYYISNTEYIFIKKIHYRGTLADWRNIEGSNASDRWDSLTEKVHFTAYHASKPATCLKSGFEEYWSCNLCDGKAYIDNLCTQKLDSIPVIPALGHDLDNGVVTQEPTCISEGVATYSCQREGCDYTETKSVPKSQNHVYNEVTYEWSEDNSECTAKEACSLCGYENVEIAKSKIDVIEEATCVKNGTAQYAVEFKNLDFETKTKTDIIPMLDHNNTEVKYRKEASCKSEGYTGDIYCKDCGKLLKAGTVIPKLEHSWNSGEIVKIATCTEEGKKTFTCTVCGITRTELLPVTEHKTLEIRNKKDVTCDEDGYTGDTYCKDCGKYLKSGDIIDAIGHKWNNGVIKKKATCTEVGEKVYTCFRCNETKSEDIPALEHSWDNGKITQNATCTEKGEKTYTCTRCHDKKNEEIPATGHKIVIDKMVSVTCTESGKTEGSRCSVCGEVIVAQKNIPATGHSWSDWKVVREATVASEGEKQRTCTKCGELEKQSIAKIIPTSTPTPTPTKVPQPTSTPVPTTAPTNPSIKTVNKGKTISVKPASSWKNVKYSTSNKKVATVDKKGKVKAVAAGTAKITVKSGSKKAVHTIIVPGTTAIKGIKTSISVKKGKTYILKSKLSYAGKADRVTYKSSNKKIATVSKKGVIKGKKKGTATITIKSGKVTKKCKVKVK